MYQIRKTEYIIRLMHTRNKEDKVIYLAINRGAIVR